MIKHTPEECNKREDTTENIRTSKNTLTKRMGQENAFTTISFHRKASTQLNTITVFSIICDMQLEFNKKLELILYYFKFYNPLFPLYMNR
ncbi:hypothetical protein C922_05497 [Plasmodium inui San Antonio 1]|uniref:Uncharacterized protein n=1 Tax=Plasmodium inui San Antonio 1 TaxID=1237626 RepID=W7AFQ7_9APIC|nr:hypothetical protein C922_05497 [Plasmodium inui San Antonio 1]EUD64126.1 hypothetical protein C922_05497 [Plasmodium inui San Antonio 1]